MADVNEGAPAADRPIDRWVARLSEAPMPVLGRTLGQLSELRRDEDNVRPRDVSQLVLHDPFMALRVILIISGTGTPTI